MIFCPIKRLYLYEPIYSWLAVITMHGVMFMCCEQEITWQVTVGVLKPQNNYNIL